MTDLADIVIRVDSTQLNNASSATQTLRQSTLNLLGSLDRVSAAQLSHTNSLRTLRNAMQQGIISQQDFARASDALRTRLEAQGLTLDNLGRVVTRNTGIFRRFGSAGMQQVGYQVGDFAVQIQGGTNALVALGQQGSQLLGIFGAGGAIAGAFLAIGTAVANIYLQTKKFKEAADNLKSSISELRTEIKLLQSGASGLTEEFGQFTSGLDRTVRLLATVSLAKAFDSARTQIASLTRDLYTSTSNVMNSTIWSQTQERTKEFQRNLGMSPQQASMMADQELALARATTDKDRLAILTKMNTEIEKQVASGATISEQGLAYLQITANSQQGLQTVVNLQKELADTSASRLETERQTSNILASRNAVEEASKIESMRKLDEISRKRKEYLADLGYEKDTLNAQKEAQFMLNGGLSVAGGLNKAAVRDKQAELRSIKEQEAYLAKNYEYYGKSRIEGEKLAKLDIAAGIKAAADQAEALAKSLGVSLSTARGIMALGNGKAEHGGEIYDPRSPNYIKGAATFADFANNRTYYEPPETKKDKKLGSKGPSEETVENRLKALYEYLGETKKVNAYLIEEENIAFSQREDLLKSALDKKLITLQEYNQMELDLTQMHQESLNKIERSRQDQRLGDASTFFGGLADVTKAGGDKTAKAARVFSAAQGLINAYLAYTQVLADPSLIGRPWARFGMAASALASGLSAVAAIKSGGGSVSGGGGSSGSVGTSKIPSESAAPTTVMIQGMKPTDIFTGEQLSTLFDSLYKENNNRGMVFMVQR